MSEDIGDSEASASTDRRAVLRGVAASALGIGAISAGANSAAASEAGEATAEDAASIDLEPNADCWTESSCQEDSRSPIGGRIYWRECCEFATGEESCSSWNATGSACST